jgi:hypothetical protein
MRMLTLLLATTLAAPVSAQTSPASPGLAAARAQLVTPSGALKVPAGADLDVDAGTLSATQLPELLDLALQCTSLPARTQVTLFASVSGTPVRVRVERDKGGRLEVQIRGIAFDARARLLELAEMFLAKGAFDVRVEGPVNGRNMEARIRDRVPQGQAVPISTAALPPPSPNAPAGLPVELLGRWRSTTINGATLLLRPATGGVIWELDAPRTAGLTLGRGALRADGTGTSNVEAVALTGRITLGDEAPGRTSNSGISLVLRREGNVLRGTATGTRNVPVTVEFIKESAQ